MGAVKELLRAPVVAKLYNEYFCELEASFTSYDSYIKDYEESHPASLAIEDEGKTAIFNYDYVSSNHDLSTMESSYVIFTSDEAGLDCNAEALICNTFKENKNISVIYGDEDEYNSNNTIRMNPWFKPGWSPDTLKDYFYFGNVVAFRTDVIKSYMAANPAKACFNDIYDMTLSLTEGMKRNEICHLDRVLFHGKYLKKLFEKGCTNYDLTDEQIKNNRVSVIVPSKDNPQILGNCLRSLIRLTRTVNYEIIIVDNGSSEENKREIKQLIETLKQDLATCGYVENAVDNEIIRYLYKPQPFNFSRMCNMGAAEAKGDYLLFLNDDIEIREGNWLVKMMRVATRKNVGAVGAKLYYPNSMMIQHAGVTNIRLGPVHKLQFKDDRVHYYMDMNNGVHNMLAVTGACLLVGKEIFNEAGGFATELEVAFNDVDLCMRLYEAGYDNAVCNNTHLWHHESLSRGDDSSQEKLERLLGERELLYIRHPQLYAYDPYYSGFLNNDILDCNYSFAYEYDYHNSTYDALLKKFDGKKGNGRYDDCLMVSLEYVGDLAQFEDCTAQNSDEVLLSGYAMVAGSDNSLFERYAVLEGKKGSYMFKLPCVYRPDLEINTDADENAAMCGFSCVVNRQELSEDEYRVGIIASGRCSRMKLYRQTNKFIRVDK